ncbi:winged helix-turn-helix transcriptional regulator [Candidatus Bathyarchaeota archaeon]|nr:winged helix-turn-helix transcriptional regulator [Candidatus Bathyarchaeota archaeon]
MGKENGVLFEVVTQLISWQLINYYENLEKFSVFLDKLQQQLTKKSSLSSLERARALVLRTVYHSRPPKVVYKITPEGRKLIQMIRNLKKR